MRIDTLSLVALALIACGGEPTTDEVTETDLRTDELPNGPQPFEVAGCSETYEIPGPFGEKLTDAVDPHEEVYGTEQNVGDSAEEGTVGPTPKHVHLGWPGQDTSNSVSFVWSTDTGTKASLVEINEGTEIGGTPKRLYGVSYQFGGSTGDRYRVHELKMCGRLKPGTTYTYRVGGEDHWSPDYTFTTPAAPGTFDSFTVAIAGDSRGSYEQWGTLVSMMEAEDPDFYLFSGDMVAVGGSQEEWYAWWEATGDVFASKVIVPAHGNHEFLASNYFAMFSLPNNEQWFGIDFGNLTLVSLNDTVPTGANILDVVQVDYMTDVFGNSGADWKAAMHHSATYSASSAHGSQTDLREFWASTFDAQKVDFVFAGHNHTYERSVPIRGGEEQASGEGTIYTVSGGAGAPLYSGHDDEWFTAYAESVEHFMIATFDSTGVEFVVRDISGNEIDRFSAPLPQR